MSCWGCGNDYLTGLYPPNHSLHKGIFIKWKYLFLLLSEWNPDTVARHWYGLLLPVPSCLSSGASPVVVRVLLSDSLVILWSYALLGLCSLEFPPPPPIFSFFSFFKITPCPFRYSLSKFFKLSVLYVQCYYSTSQHSMSYTVIITSTLCLFPHRGPRSHLIHNTSLEFWDSSAQSNGFSQWCIWMSPGCTSRLKRALGWEGRPWENQLSSQGEQRESTHQRRLTKEDNLQRAMFGIHERKSFVF